MLMNSFPLLPAWILLSPLILGIVEMARTPKSLP